MGRFRPRDGSVFGPSGSARCAAVLAFGASFWCLLRPVDTDSFVSPTLATQIVRRQKMHDDVLLARPVSVLLGTSNSSATTSGSKLGQNAPPTAQPLLATKRPFPHTLPEKKTTTGEFCLREHPRSTQKKRCVQDSRTPRDPPSTADAQASGGLPPKTPLRWASRPQSMIGARRSTCPERAHTHAHTQARHITTKTHPGITQQRVYCVHEPPTGSAAPRR